MQYYKATMQHSRGKCTWPDWSTGHSCMCQALQGRQLTDPSRRLWMHFKNCNACLWTMGLDKANTRCRWIGVVTRETKQQNTFPL